TMSVDQKSREQQPMRDLRRTALLRQMMRDLDDLQRGRAEPRQADVTVPVDLAFALDLAEHAPRSRFFRQFLFEVSGVVLAYLGPGAALEHGAQEISLADRGLGTRGRETLRLRVSVDQQLDDRGGEFCLVSYDEPRDQRLKLGVRFATIRFRRIRDIGDAARDRFHLFHAFVRRREALLVVEALPAAEAVRSESLIEVIGLDAQTPQRKARKLALSHQAQHHVRERYLGAAVHDPALCGAQEHVGHGKSEDVQVELRLLVEYAEDRTSFVLAVLPHDGRPGFFWQPAPGIAEIAVRQPAKVRLAGVVALAALPPRVTERFGKWRARRSVGEEVER